VNSTTLFNNIHDLVPGYPGPSLHVSNNRRLVGHQNKSVVGIQPTYRFRSGNNWGASTQATHINNAFRHDLSSYAKTI
jgi:hypothetical protein